MTLHRDEHRPIGSEPTEAQRRTIERWRKRNPRCGHKLSRRSTATGYISIIPTRWATSHTVTLDAEGFEVGQRWVRIESPYNPQPEAAPDPQEVTTDV